MVLLRRWCMPGKANQVTAKTKPSRSQSSVTSKTQKAPKVTAKKTMPSTSQSRVLHKPQIARTASKVRKDLEVQANNGMDNPSVVLQVRTVSTVS